MTRRDEVVKAMANYDSFGSLLSSGGKRLLIVDLHPKWCGPCAVMVPTFDQMLDRSRAIDTTMKLDLLSITREQMLQWMVRAKLNIAVSLSLHAYRAKHGKVSGIV